MQKIPNDVKKSKLLFWTWLYMTFNLYQSWKTKGSNYLFVFLTQDTIFPACVLLWEAFYQLNMSYLCTNFRHFWMKWNTALWPLTFGHQEHVKVLSLWHVILLTKNGITYLEREREREREKTINNPYRRHCTFDVHKCSYYQINWHYDTKVVITKNKDNNTLHYKMKEW